MHLTATELDAICLVFPIYWFDHVLIYQEKCLDCANITVILAIPGTAQKHWKNAETCSRLVLHNTVSLLGAQSKEFYITL